MDIETIKSDLIKWIRSLEEKDEAALNWLMIIKNSNERGKEK